MTHRAFIESLESYYGLTYRPGMQEPLRRFLKTVPEADLQELYDETLRGVSAQFKTLPDIAAFEEAQKRIREDRKALAQFDGPQYQRYLPESTEGLAPREKIDEAMKKLKDKYPSIMGWWGKGARE